MMVDLAKRLFVGIKISKALQNELDNPAPGTQHYFEGNEHNEYLQIAAEGGLLLGVPMACAIAAAVWTIASRLRRDRTPIFWIRAGAASSLVAIGVQSIWETGLRMPANAVLFALCVALAVHEARPRRRRAVVTEMTEDVGAEETESPFSA